MFVFNECILKLVPNVATYPATSKKRAVCAPRFSISFTSWATGTANIIRYVCVVCNVMYINHKLCNLNYDRMMIPEGIGRAQSAACLRLEAEENGTRRLFAQAYAHRMLRVVSPMRVCSVQLVVGVWVLINFRE